MATDYRLDPGRGSINFVPLGRPARIRTARSQTDVLLRIRRFYSIMTEAEVAQDRYRLVTLAYSYEILDLEDREILSFHWHPDGPSTVTHPHLHLSSKVRPIPVAEDSGSHRAPSLLALAQMHIPTGPVLFENVVRLLIEEFGVVPLRPDWDEVLRRNEDLLRASD